jgi:hypothetical protein
MTTVEFVAVITHHVEVVQTLQLVTTMPQLSLMMVHVQWMMSVEFVVAQGLLMVLVIVLETFLMNVEFVEAAE